MEQPAPALWIARELAREDLHRDFAAEHGVLGQEHLPHPPFPEGFQDSIAAEGRPDHGIMIPSGGRGR